MAQRKGTGAAPKAAGRRAQYSDDALRRKFGEIGEWAGAECSDREIAERLGVSAVTFASYKKRFPALKKLLGEARRRFVSVAEGSLLRLVRGFDYEERSTLYDGKGKVTGTTVTRRHAPPQCRAIEMFLNRYDPRSRKNVVEDRDYDLDRRKQELAERTEEDRRKAERLRLLMWK
jgi:hypothetical protein